MLLSIWTSIIFLWNIWIKEKKLTFLVTSLLAMFFILVWYSETFPSGCLTLDFALGGGLPKGRIVEVWNFFTYAIIPSFTINCCMPFISLVFSNLHELFGSFDLNSNKLFCLLFYWYGYSFCMCIPFIMLDLIFLNVLVFLSRYMDQKVVARRPWHSMQLLKCRYYVPAYFFFKF